ncbi:MAG: cobalamin biosynthesis protein CobW [Paracoccaceae bacterium]|nr:cobalamin biosynthesis protein CobW [Paracoccaceae bacterium]
MPQKIPTTVITGFLGAGKTTLIRNLLARNGGKRIALVINEFGDIGVDGEVLKGCGDALCAEDDIIELSNGCICCTVADDFVPTMTQLLDRDAPPDHIVIETSGLALPQPLVRAFNWPEIRTRVTVDGVITVVDGPAARDGRFAHDESAVAAQREADDSIDHETPLSELFEDQLACADMVVVSKTDRMSGPEVEGVLGGLGDRTRQGVHFVRSDTGGLEAGVLLGLGLSAEDDLESRHEVHHHHHDDEEDDHEHEHGHDEFETFALTMGEVADANGFAERLAAAIREHDILRLKGFVAVAGKPMRLVVQAVGPRIETYFDRPFGGEPRATRLVVIGEAGLDRLEIEKAIGAAAG